MTTLRGTLDFRPFCHSSFWYSFSSFFFSLLSRADGGESWENLFSEFLSQIEDVRVFLLRVLFLLPLFSAMQSLFACKFRVCSGGHVYNLLNS